MSPTFLTTDQFLHIKNLRIERRSCGGNNDVGFLGAITNPLIKLPEYQIKKQKRHRYSTILSHFEKAACQAGFE